jgi:CheY-like chemotaxis protein
MKKRILIAEDNDSNYDLLYEILQLDYEIIRAVNGQEAISLYKSEKIDLILMDLSMPVLDGYEATKKIREENASIPIIAQSAHVFEDEKHLAIEAGCNTHINKPIMITELLSAIEQFI